MECKWCGKKILFVDKRLKYCSSECAKVAKREYNREWSRAHREWCREYNRKWRRTHPENVRKWRRARCEKLRVKHMEAKS